MAAWAEMSIERIRVNIRKARAFGRLCLFHARRRSLEETVDWALDFKSRKDFMVKTQQIRSEILTLAKVVADSKPQVVLEIGSAYGGTLLIWAQIAGELLISCDIEDRTYRHSFYRRFPPPGSRCSVEMLVGDSHEPSFRKKVESLLGGRKVDFLFIDGDHTREGVAADFHDYRDLVRPGGIVAFHDIVEKQCIAENQVYDFWKTIRGDASAREIIGDPGQTGFGIGIIRMPGEQGAG